MRWQLELVANVVAALSSVGDVDRKDQSFVAKGLHPVHQLLRQFPVPVHIQLEPAVTVWSCCNNLLHRAGRVCAGDVAGVESLGGCMVKFRFTVLTAYESTHM